MYSVFEQLLQKHGISTYRVAKDTGIAQSVFSSWKNGISSPKQDKLQKIADYFGVTVDYLITGKEKTLPDENSLSAKDQRDIQKILDQTREQLMNQEGLMFDGDPASPEAIESILSAMQIGMEMAKKKNKEKYTPEKYRKKKD